MKAVGSLKSSLSPFSWGLVVLLFLLVWFGTAASGYPHFPFAAQTIGVPGMTAVEMFASSGGPGFTVTRAVTDRVDLTLKFTDSSGVAFSGRWELLDWLGVLSVGLDLSWGGFSVSSGLFFGPVRLDWGRRFAPNAARWVLLTVSRPGLSVGFGIHWKTRPVFYGGIRLFGDMRWVDLFARGQELTISIGGLF